MAIESILPTPDVFSARRILCIQPHYDDNDIGAAGLLTRLAQNGAEIFYLTVSDDLKGVVDGTLSDEAATENLKQDQLAAAKLVGVKELIGLDYPDAGEYNYFDLRRDLLKIIRRIRPDFVFTCDPWLTYEGHRDHVRTGIATTESVMFAGMPKILSSDPLVDANYRNHEIRGIAYYYTREPNLIIDIASTWETKLSAICCYKTQFDQVSLDELCIVIDAKSRQVAQGKGFDHGEAFTVLHPGALHCGL